MRGRGRHRFLGGGGCGGTGCNLREEVHRVSALLDVVLAVLGEVAQHVQGLHADGDAVFIRPDLHRDQDHAGEQLVLKDLVPRGGAESQPCTQRQRENIVGGRRLEKQSGA